jgi:hypothetical protein
VTGMILPFAWLMPSNTVFEQAKECQLNDIFAKNDTHQVSHFLVEVVNIV